MSSSLSLLAQRDYRESPTNYNLFCNLRCHIAKNILNSHDRVCRLDRFSHLVNKDFFTAYFFFTGFAAPRGRIVVTGSLAAAKIHIPILRSTRRSLSPANDGTRFS